MANICYSKLRIKIGRHTRDKLVDLLGPDMFIDQHYREKIDDLSYLCATLTSYNIGHRGCIPEWDKYLSSDNIQFQILTARDGFWKDFKDILCQTKFDNFPDVISDAAYNSDNNSTIDYQIFRIENGSAIYDVAAPMEEDGFFVWEFDSSWAPPTNTIKMIAASLVDQEIQFNFSEPGNNYGGFYFFNNGKSFGSSHEDYFYPSLDVALDRGITAVEVERFIENVTHWPFHGEPENIAPTFDDEYGVQIVNEDMAIRHLIKNILSIPVENIISEISTPGAIRLALTALTYRQYPPFSSNNNVEPFVDQLLSVVEETDTRFNKEAFLFFVSEIMPEDYTIGDIERTIESAMNKNTAAADRIVSVEIDLAELRNS